MTPTTNATRHVLAAAALVRACAAIKAALHHEEGLEWWDRLDELLREAQWMAKRLEEYNRE